MQQALEIVKNQFLAYFSPSIQLIEVISDWWPTLYAVWEKANFSTAIVNDLYTYLQIVSIIPAPQRPLFEKQIWSLQQLDEPELSLRLKAIIHFAKHFNEHQFKVFEENEFLQLIELWMGQLDENWLDIQIATRKSLKKTITRTNENQFYDFYQARIVGANIASIQRFHEALMIFNQARRSLPWYAYHYFLDEYLSGNTLTEMQLQQAVEVFGMSLEIKFERLQYRCLNACTESSGVMSYASLFSELDKIDAISLTSACLERFWADYIQHKHIQTRANLQQAVSVYQQTQIAPFVGTCLSEMLLKEPLTQASVAAFQRFMTCLQQYALSPIMINVFFAAFQKNAQIQSAAALHQVIKLGQQIYSIARESNLSQQFFHQLPSYTLRDINELQLFLDTVAPHELPPEAIDALFKYFRRSSIEQLNEAIHVMKLAIKLSTKDDLLRQYFDDLNTNKTDRIMLMRYLYHGLLDFLGEDFREKCLHQHEALYVSSSHHWISGAIPKRENFIFRLSEWHNAMCGMMHEFGEILRKPLESSDFRANAFVFCVPKHHDFFKAHQKNYEHFGLSVNASRKRQAKHFFKELNKVRAHEKDPQRYYTQIFDKIFTTQHQIMREDQRLNQTRWFFKLNMKGYSRLYDTTNQILREMLQHYHQAVAHGSIKPTQYIIFQETLRNELFIQVQYFAKGLPEKHPLRQALISIEKKDTKHLSSLLQKEHQIPNHLKHLAENVHHYLILNEGVQNQTDFSLGYG